MLARCGVFSTRRNQFSGAGLKHLKLQQETLDRECCPVQIAPMEAHALEWLHLVVRWFHVIHWFKWEACFTWISGFSLLILVYYFGVRAQLMPSTPAPCSLPGSPRVRGQRNNKGGPMIAAGEQVTGVVSVEQLGRETIVRYIEELEGPLLPWQSGSPTKAYVLVDRESDDVIDDIITGDDGVREEYYCWQDANNQTCRTGAEFFALGLRWKANALYEASQRGEVHERNGIRETSYTASSGVDIGIVQYFACLQNRILPFLAIDVSDMVYRGPRSTSYGAPHDVSFVSSWPKQPSQDQRCEL